MKGNYSNGSMTDSTRNDMVLDDIHNNCDIGWNELFDMTNIKLWQVYLTQYCKYNFFC